MQKSESPTFQQYQEYERQKRVLVESNPYMTPEKYAKEIAKIAARIGI